MNANLFLGHNDLTTFTGRQAQLVSDIRTFAIFERSVDVEIRANLSLAARAATDDATLDDIRVQFAFVVALAPIQEQI